MDVKAPAIERITVNGSDENVVSVAAGSALSVNYLISDNMGLYHCTAGIHAANDGHKHSSGSLGGEYQLTSGKWSITPISKSISGTSYEGTLETTIPDSIGGVWHIEIKAEDAVGYSASRAVSLHVTNENLPMISLTSSSPEISNDGYIHLTSGSTVTINAIVNDPDGLTSVYIRLISSSGSVITQLTVPSFGTTANFPASFDNVSTGDYRIVIDAFDALGYHSVWDARLKVMP